MSQPSRLPRVALAIACSLVAHLLLVVAIANLRPKPISGTQGPDLVGGLRLSLAPDGPQRRDPPLPRGDVWLTPKIEPRIVPPPIQATPSPGGTVKRPPSSVSSGNANSTGGNVGGAGPGAGLGLFTFDRPPRSLVWVLDRSISMGLEGALDIARSEILAGLRRLPRSATFRVIAYNRHASLIPASHSLLVPAQADEIVSTCAALESLLAEGSTDHLAALRVGLNLRPAVLFLVTDAADLSLGDVQTLTRLNQGRTAIHVLELSASRTPRPDGPAANLAAANGGAYRHHSLAR